MVAWWVGRWVSGCGMEHKCGGRGVCHTYLEDEAISPNEEEEAWASAPTVLLLVLVLLHMPVASSSSWRCCPRASACCATASDEGTPLPPLLLLLLPRRLVALLLLLPLPLPLLPKRRKEPTFFSTILSPWSDRVCDMLRSEDTCPRDGRISAAAWPGPTPRRKCACGGVRGRVAGECIGRGMVDGVVHKGFGVA